MVKLERNISKIKIKENNEELFCLLYRFLVNQLFNGSNPDDPNLKRDLTVYPEKTSKRLNLNLLKFKI